MDCTSARARPRSSSARTSLPTPSLLIPGGELVDRFGARRLALVGLALFAVGAAAGALAGSFVELLVARVVQGAGAGLVSPAALAGAVSGFPPERRGRALGIWGASAGMSNLLGPLLGGVLTVALGWRADWWALVPLTIAAGRCDRPADARDRPRRRGATTRRSTGSCWRPRWSRGSRSRS